MNDKQLPVFSWQTLVMGEGYRCLADFQFEDAERYFREVLHAGTEVDEEARRALDVCKYWQPVVLQGNEPSPVYSIDDLYRHFCEYEFPNTPGLHQFKNAMLRYIADGMVARDRFYIHDHETVSDLLLKLQDYQMAERIVLQRMKKHFEDHRLRYCLAQIQWLKNLKGEAKKSYTLALLHDPCRLHFDRIQFEDLKKLIDTVGGEMAPCYGWVRGILPLVPLQEEVNICSEVHRKAIDCYRLLRAVVKTKKKNDMDACVEYRKKLKERAPDLYKEYYDLLSKRGR